MKTVKEIAINGEWYLVFYYKQYDIQCMTFKLMQVLVGKLKLESISKQQTDSSSTELTLALYFTLVAHLNT